MLIDCFTFFRELDMLEGRLEYLYNYVDYFVIVEADVTHSGNKKDLNYLKNIRKYKKYYDKILYFPISIDLKEFDSLREVDKSSYSSYNWAIEKKQRSHIDNALKLFPDDAHIMIGDVDEFPIRSRINQHKSLLSELNAFSLIQKLYNYNFNQYSSVLWAGTVFANNLFAKKHGVQWLRDMRGNIPTVHDAGYHLSYWGTPEDIKIKIENFAHQELNNEYNTDIKLIKERIIEGRDPYDRMPMIKSNPSDIDSDFFSIFNKYTFQ
jgi:beta-1,4-mannosyl-glycoprotein beta-1,4-N-acetylglucosaminyltransferase